MARVFEMKSEAAGTSVDHEEFRVWGHTMLELHDAYWRSQGVQCVRRSEDLELQTGSDLYMLLEPGQCAVFELSSLANAIVWNRAPLSRIRVLSTDRRYIEKVIVNTNNELVKIAREYGGLNNGSCRVLLTRRASLAQVWSKSSTRRTAWTELRRIIDWTKTDHYRTEGLLSKEGHPEQSELMLRKLVETWKDPSIAIEGITQIQPGVWGVDSRQLTSTTHVISPVWLGFDGSSTNDPVIIGPQARCDDPASRGRGKIKLLNIDEIWSGSTSTERKRSNAEQDVTTYQLVKRTIDIMVSLAILICVSPILFVVALAVALDNGFPLFFGHTRQSLGGRDFKCWKFRTMMKNAESMVQDLQSDNLADGPQVFIKDDPRITRVGRVLRRFHLDELPQFWNVLVGDMSLVGPRPSPDKENQFCPAWRESRLSVRPGITGLWQVERTRAPGLDFQEWIRYDIEYVNRASLMLDAKICFKTLYRIVSG
ncbi:MAG: hypothetical protein CBC35_00235 [Planctomycetes bacterium TMED75]|nr:hypothetical protein [Planctomycetaceae bacterium]OUU96958.1 MAG: hypothetical protein CBC35_00235 [Planctomycetes bacterium TMED75]